MHQNLERVHILYQQGRFDLAEQILRQTLSTEPDEAEAHAMLAQCLVQRKAFDEAFRGVERAVSLAPNDPYPAKVMARFCSIIFVPLKLIVGPNVHLSWIHSIRRTTSWLDTFLSCKRNSRMLLTQRKVDCDWNPSMRDA